MSTRREEVLAALLGCLQTVPDAAVKHEEPLPEKVPTGGLLILRDGDPGEPEVLLSPLTYLWQHRAEIEVVVQKAAAEAPETLDDLLAALFYHRYLAPLEGRAAEGDRKGQRS
jgi:hypothetical protein